MNRREFLVKSAQGAVAAVAAGPAGYCAAALGADRSGRPATRPAKGPLEVHPDNRRYFTDGSGRAVYLTGSHTWSNLVDIGPADPPPPFDFAAYLDWIQQFNHNFVRMWTWEPVTWDTKDKRKHTAAPQPWARTGPGRALDGKPKFDLTRFDPGYFDRLGSRVAAAGDRGIYVSVMLFEGWAVQFTPGAWPGHPFHRDNNVNGIDGDPGGDGKGLEVWTLGNQRVTALQEGYVRKVIDTVNHQDNVLYEISNENHPPSTQWQYHIIRYIHEYERHKAKRHPVGMTFQYKGGRNSTLFDSPAEWISPNQEGGYRDDPPAADGRKVVLSDTDHLWGIGGSQAWVWKSFIRGLNPLFMDPYDGLVLGTRFERKWDPIRRALGYTRRYANRVNLAAMVPHNDLASTRYCLADPGAGYLVYLPSGGEVSVDLSAARGRLAVEWFDPTAGRASAADGVQGGVRRKFTAPFSGDAVLCLTARTT